MGIKDASGKISDRNKRHGIGHWTEGDPYYKVAKSLAELCPGWKEELVSDELGYLAEEISNQVWKA